MKLLRLTMEAFGPYLGRQEIDFSPAHKSGLFLVQGPTGSGKSSILDAICFCLYDVVSGDKKNEHAELRCHLAPDAVRTSVCLEFELAGRHYRAQRSFGPRKGTVDNHQCLLEILEGPQSWKPLYTRLSDAVPVLTGLLGLRADQFRQVILLPQGKFRDFLTATSAVRTELLKALFNTDTLTDFLERLKERRDAIRTAMLEHQGRMRTFLQSLELEQPDQLDQLADQTRQDLQSGQAACQDLRARTELARLAMQKALEQEDLASRIPELQRQQAALAAKKPEMEQLATRLAAARKVAPLVERGAAIKQQQQNLEALGDEVLAASQTLEQTRTRLASLEARQPEISARGSEIVRQQARQILLDQLLAQAQARDKQAASLEQARTDLARISQDVTRQAARLQAARQAISSLEPGTASGQDQTGTALVALERLEQLEQRRADLSTRLANLEESSQLRVMERQAIDQDLGRLAAEQRQASARLEAARQQYLADQATILRSRLQAGEPCPVCGSLEHPADQPGLHPTGAIQARDFQDLEQQARKLELALSEREARHVNLSERIREDQAAIQDLHSQVQTVITEWQASQAELNQAIAAWQAAAPGPSQAATPAAGCLDEAGRKDYLARSRNAIQACQDKTQKQILALQAAQQDLSACQSRQDQLAGQLHSQEALCSNLAQDLAVIQTAMAELCRHGVPDALSPVASTDQIRHFMQAQGQEIQAMTASIHDWETELKLAQANAGHNLSTLEEKKQRRTSLAASLAEQHTAFQSELASVGFHSIESARQAWMAPKAIDEAEHGLREWQQDSHNTEFRLAELQSRVDPDFRLPALQARQDWQELNAALEARVQATGRLQALDTQIQKVRQELQKSSSQFQAAETAFSLHEGLYRALSGKDNKFNIDLERYALSVYLDEVLEEANHHLDCMSRGRYQLERLDEGTDKRRTMGLDISIMDAYTGKGRSSSSLSGGESFMAALALALGLSTVVHRRSGGIRLDTLLIDEGFGSLDEEALQDALSVLSLLKEKGQLVGIISHVRELQERLGCRLMVSRSPAGSSVSWAD